MGDEAHELTMPVFAVQRASGYVEVSPCPDGQDAWHWAFYEHNAPATRYAATNILDTTTGTPYMVEVPNEPVVTHLDTRRVMALLSGDEATAFLGWISHLHEQAVTHLSHVAEAMKQAIDERKWKGAKALLPELEAAVNLREQAQIAGLEAFELSNHS